MKVLLFLALIFSSQPLLADIEESDLLPLFEAVCQELDVSQNIVLAISKVESGFNPWALNIEGKGFQFNSKDEALAKAKEASKAGKSFDSGLMQVNNWWLKRYEIPLEAALDPEANIYLGAWILKNEIANHGTLKAAVGAYHSPNKAKANRYADVVMAAVAKEPKPNKKIKSTKKQSVPAKAVKVKTYSSSEAASPMLVQSQTNNKKPYSFAYENLGQTMKVSNKK